MTREKLRDYLSNYKYYIARIEILELLIKDKDNPERKEIIDASGSGLDSMGIRGSVNSDATLSKVIKLESLEAIYNKELDMLNRITKVIDIALKGLTEKERIIIEKFYFEGFTNIQVADYISKNSVYESVDNIKRIKRTILTKMLKIICTKNTRNITD